MNEKLFFDAMRVGLLGPKLDEGEVTGCQAILEACAGFPVAWTAYALATAYHETAHTMLPVKEFGGPKYFARMYDITGARPTLARKYGNTNVGDGVKFAGRGYVQLTWRMNYKRAGEKLGVDLLRDPDLAMNKDIAAMILRHGMREGWFTGQGFSDHLTDTGPAGRAQFRSARKIINGTDKADLIAGYALEFQEASIAAGWLN
jgi:putative chitinase